MNLKNYETITIEREYASGGTEIGKALAERLNIPFYGQEVLEIVSQKYGYATDAIRALEETISASTLYNIVINTQFYNQRLDGIPLDYKLFSEISKTIKEIAYSGPSVIVGRCANYILRDKKDCLNTFIYADKNTRIERAINEYGISNKNVESTLKKADKRRSNYYKSYSSMNWNDTKGYHLCLNSGKLGIEKCVDIIYKLVQ